MSMWDLFETCHARYDMRHNQNLSVPISRKATALDSGGLAHEGLEVYYNGIKNGIDFPDRMHGCIRRIQAVASDPDQCNLDQEEVTRVLSAVEESCTYWRYEDEYQEILEVERPFAYVLFEDEFIRIIISGKIDLLVNKPGIGNNASYYSLPKDHKTYSKDFEVPLLSNQFMNYCVATGSKFLEVNRIGLHDPEAKKPKPTEEKMKRVMLSYDNEQLEYWKKNLLKGIMNEYLMCVSSGEWRENYTSCFKFNRKCEYYDACLCADLEKKRQLLQEGFIIASPWDVTAKFKKD